MADLTVFAEPSSRDEAYVPLRHSPARNIAILNATLNRIRSGENDG